MSHRVHMPTLRVLNIMELLAEHPDGLTLTEISNSINSPKSTVLPIIRTLRDEKYVFYNSKSSLYRVGVSAFSTGSAYIRNMSSLEFVRTEMKYVARQCEEICQLGILNKNMALFIAEESNTAISHVTRVGKHLPLYCSAIGKSLICKMGIDELIKLHPNGFEAYTTNTVSSFEMLIKELENICSDDYVSYDRGEMSPDLSCISVPLFKHEDIIAAVSVSISAFQVTDEKLNQIRKLLLDMRLKVKHYLELNNVDSESLIISGGI